MDLLDTLRTRATLYRSIRQFFFDRDVLEVETPLLCSHTVTDIHVAAIPAANHRFLQTSPEYAMKRLLAQGSGAIFQICKAFRDEEVGSNHNPEFTMLEWYRPGFTQYQLMDEVDELIRHLLNTKPASKQSYRECFLTHVNIDPVTVELSALHNFIQKNNLLFNIEEIDHDTALQVILTHCIEPHIGHDTPFFLYDFPPSQACLAKIRQEPYPVGERFELYYKGFELANGFHELIDPIEQEERFRRDQKQRQARGLPVPAIDHYLIDALKYGIPATSGVAIGLDRLVMLACGATCIQKVLPFSWHQV